MHVADLEKELGLVDEAKAVVEKWMARWIDVVSLPLRPKVASLVDKPATDKQ